MAIAEQVDARPGRARRGPGAACRRPGACAARPAPAAPTAVLAPSSWLSPISCTSTWAVASASGSARWQGCVGTPKKWASEASPTRRSRPSSSRRASAAVQSGGSDRRRVRATAAARESAGRTARCGPRAARRPRRRGSADDGSDRGAPRSSCSRSPVSRAIGSGSATRGLTSDWNESTSSRPRTRTAPISQIRSRAAESPVVSRSKTTNSASSSKGSERPPTSETRRARADDPAVAGRHLFEQRAGEPVGDRRRREERPGRLDHGQRAALLERVDEPVERVEGELHLSDESEHTFALQAHVASPGAAASSAPIAGRGARPA